MSLHNYVININYILKKTVLLYFPPIRTFFKFIYELILSSFFIYAFSMEGLVCMPNNIGSNIAAERRKQNMTQEQLAEASDITINYLSKVERGASKQVSAITLSSIAKALNVSIDSLINKENSKNLREIGPKQQQLKSYLNSLNYTDRENLSDHILKILTFHQ